jgi:hypothetical protein
MLLNIWLNLFFLLQGQNYNYIVFKKNKKTKILIIPNFQNSDMESNIYHYNIIFKKMRK